MSVTQKKKNPVGVTFQAREKLSFRRLHIPFCVQTPQSLNDVLDVTRVLLFSPMLQKDPQKMIR